MKQYNIQLESLQPIIFSRMMVSTKGQREKDSEYDQRIWREKAHYTDEGYVKIPCVFFKRALESSAKYLKEQIPGQGKATYSKPFLSAVQVVDDMVLPVKKEDVLEVLVNAHSKGIRGPGPRVVRHFPSVAKWEGELVVFVGDDVISSDVLIRHLKAAGQFIGIGSFRAETGNQSGRFRIKTDKNGKLLVKESEVKI